MTDAQSHAPGLKRRKRPGGFAFYWIPPAKDVKAGYVPKLLSFPPGTSNADIAERCRNQWADLEKWRMGFATGPAPYTLEWLISRYQADEHSPYRNLRGRTIRSYDHLCRLLSVTIGKHSIAKRNITGEDVLRWHRKWGRTDKDGKAQAPSTARHAITMLRTLARYALIIGVPGARDFKDLLSTMEFPTGQPRSVAPTREQVKAIVDQAEKDGYLSIAIATQAQFDLVERRTHIIGYWDKGRWDGGWRWQDIGEDWVIRYHQTKVGLVLREFDLNDTPRLKELLELVPKEKRIGPVIVCERKREGDDRSPWNERHYADVFREICRRAGVGDDIKSMDMRAGGATEADLIVGVSDRMLQDALGHKDPRTKDRYRRQKQRNAQNVVKLRQENVKT